MTDSLNDFDALWDYDRPAETETRFRDLLPAAERNPDVKMQLLTQIARAQGLQRRFEDAHATLEEVETGLPPGALRPRIRYLLERNIRGFGVETIGTDAGQAHLLDPAYPAHTLLHGAGRLGLQCLENLDALPATGSILICPPLKIRDGSGSPLRVLALVPA